MFGVQPFCFRECIRLLAGGFERIYVNHVIFTLKEYPIRLVGLIPPTSLSKPFFQYLVRCGFEALKTKFSQEM